MRRAALFAIGTALAAIMAVAPANAQQALGVKADAAPKAARTYDHTKPYPAYTAPKTAWGAPNLMGIWSNASLTQLTRPAALKDQVVMTDAQVAELENNAQIEIEEGNAATDPNAPADFVQKTTVQRPEFAAAGGDVGGYNRGWLDPGNLVMRVNGEARTSLLTTPTGSPPARKAGAQVANADVPGFMAHIGESPVKKGGAFENMESRSAGERCIVSFGRNGGPPMFANGFYNNNYEFVQTPDHVVINVEMNHDPRIIRLNAKH
ncbi:MAG TPA: hypothetical protein PK050_15705, partial [Hyphomonadaceae bacterium]|nr:hypothetical protein [Hyphomonadaceae bacterium]